MNPQLIEDLNRLRKIERHLHHLLADAEKRTPGRWETLKGSRHGCDVKAKTSPVAQCDFNGDSEDTANATFIASCAENAEAGWRTSLAAVRHCQLIIDLGISKSTSTQNMIRDLLAAWPEELLAC